MELTLRLTHAGAAQIARLPIVKVARDRPARSRAETIVWHDGAGGELAARGLAFAECRGVWRMTRHWPAPDEIWPPGHPPVDVVDGVPDVVPSGGLVPRARFDGRRTVFALTIDGGPVAMTLLTGTLRAGTAERPVARLTLSGAMAAVRVFVADLSDAIPLEVPAESLAMEAARLAGGVPPRPAGASTALVPGLPAETAFAHIIGYWTETLIALAPDAARGGPDTEPVHRLRVAVRRARSALSLFAAIVPDPLLPGVADGLRALGQVLGPARDWDVFATETLPPIQAALPGRPALASLERAAARKRVAAHQTLTAWLDSPGYRRLILDLACLAAADPPPAGGTDLTAAATAILTTLWKKTRRTGRAADELDNPGLHALRLKAKRIRYAAEFFAPLFPRKPAARFIRRLSALQERLGVFNDSAVVEALLATLDRANGQAAGLVLGFSAARAAGIRPKILAAWDRLQKRDPFWT